MLPGLLPKTLDYRQNLLKSYKDLPSEESFSGTANTAL